MMTTLLAIYALCAAAAAPAAASDTATFVIVDPGSNAVTTESGARSTKPASEAKTTALPIVGHEYRLERFSLVETPINAIGSSSAGAGAGRVAAVTFTATTPLDGTSAALLSLHTSVPNITVTFAHPHNGGTVARENFRGCALAQANSNQSGANVNLTFTCLSSSYTAATGSSEGGRASSHDKLDVYLKFRDTTVRVTSFSVDPPLAQALDRNGQTGGAGSGRVQFGTFGFTLPLDGTGKAIADLNGRGQQQEPILVRFVRAGGSAAKPFLTEEFSLWSVKSVTTSFGGGSATDAYVLEFAAMKESH